MSKTIEQLMYQAINTIADPIDFDIPIEFAVVFANLIRAQPIKELAGVDVEPVAFVTEDDEPIIPMQPLYTIDQLAAHNVQTRALVQQLVDALNWWEDSYGINWGTAVRNALTAGRAWLDMHKNPANLDTSSGTCIGNGGN